MVAADMPPPQRPKFDVTMDRFFNDVFLAGGPFAIGRKGDTGESLLTDE